MNRDNSIKFVSPGKVAVSLPVHEKPHILRDQALNFGYFFPEALLIVHVSKSSEDSFESFIEATEGLSNVVFNPDRTVTRWGDALGPHIRNFRYALNELIGIEYLTFASSTDMMVKKGVFNHIKKFDLAYDRQSVVTREWKSDIIQECFADISFQRLLKEMGSNNAIYSQIEGSFYSVSIMRELIPVVERHFDVYACDAKYFREEFVFSTIANKICNQNSKILIGEPYTLRGMFAYNWARSLANGNQFFEPATRLLARLLRIAYPAFWRLATLKRSIKYDFENLRCFAKCNGISKYNPSAIYSIKRVRPDLCDPIRKYLSSQINK